MTHPARHAIALFVALLLASCAARVLPPDTDPEAVLAPILERLAAVRQLRVLRPVPVEVASPARVRQIMLEQMDEEYSPEKLAASEQIYRALDLIPPGLDLRQTLLQLFSQEVAAFYLPAEDRMVVVSPVRKPQLALVMSLPGGRERFQDVLFSHELVHALEDQHFGLERFQFEEGADEDFLVAVHAVSEGSALLAQVLYMAENTGRSAPGLSDYLLDRLENKTLVIGGGRYPKILTEPMAFSYQSGLHFVRAVYREKGFAGINALYDDPRLSSELILHPEKYLGRSDPPLPVDLPASLPGLLPGYHMLDSNVLGELGVRLVLSERLPVAEARAAATGWGGDRYAWLADEVGNFAWVWATRWDSDQDAAEFRAALARWNALRRPGRGLGEETIAHRGSWVLHTLGLGPQKASLLAQELGLADAATSTAIPL